MQVNKKLFLKKLGLQLKKLRKDRNMTQAELAYKIKKDQQSIQRLEAGVINPTLYFLNEIAEGLNVPLVCFFSFEFTEDNIRDKVTMRNNITKDNSEHYKIPEGINTLKAAEDPEEFFQTIHFQVPWRIKDSSYHRELLNNIKDEILFLKKSHSTE